MTLYSIGHSNATIDAFLDLLRRHEIAALVDTRSQPFSRYNAHFSRAPLQGELQRQEIEYVFLGAELGGRPAGAEFYFESGKVNYDAVAASPIYLAGIERLLALGRERRVAFLCSEGDYKQCHRYWLITRTLVARGVAVAHILPTGEVVYSDAAEFELAQPRLF